MTTFISEFISEFSPGELWLDDNGVHINAHGGGILYHDETYYWFGEHKIEGELGNSAQVGVHVYSSRDLTNWKDNGIALEVSDDPQSAIARGCILERPKVIYNAKTGKFVMWFHLEPMGQGYDGARSGVAVSDQPTGPFQLVESLRPNAGVWPFNAPEELRRPLTSDESAQLSQFQLAGAPYAYFPKNWVFRRDFDGGQMARDMTLFVDDDGTAFHIYSSEDNGTLHISQLSDDYLQHSGRYARVFPGRFHEAPALMKHQGRYFLFSSDCTGWLPNPGRVSVADSIWGPWEELSTPCLGTPEEVVSTFESQSTFVLPIAGLPDAFIFMADRWRPENAVDGRYIWLPIEFRLGIPMIAWHDRWDLNFFKQASGEAEISVANFAI